MPIVAAGGVSLLHQASQGLAAAMGFYLGGDTVTKPADETALTVREPASIASGGLQLTSLPEYAAFAKWAAWARILPCECPDSWTVDQKTSHMTGLAIMKMQAGAELGIAPMAAISNIHVIEGRCSPSAHMLAAVIKKSGKYKIKIVERTAERCALNFFERAADGWARCSPLEVDSEFTIQDAEQAELLGPKKKNWHRYPKHMLYARALSQGADMYCTELFGGGVLTPEGFDNAEVIDVEVGPEPKVDDEPCAEKAAPQPELPIVPGVDPHKYGDMPEPDDESPRSQQDEEPPPNSPEDLGFGGENKAVASDRQVQRLRTIHWHNHCVGGPDTDQNNQWRVALTKALAAAEKGTLTGARAGLLMGRYKDSYKVTSEELDEGWERREKARAEKHAKETHSDDPKAFAPSSGNLKATLDRVMDKVGLPPEDEPSPGPCDHGQGAFRGKCVLCGEPVACCHPSRAKLPNGTYSPKCAICNACTCPEVNDAGVCVFCKTRVPGADVS